MAASYLGAYWAYLQPGLVLEGLDELLPLHLAGPCSQPSKSASQGLMGTTGTFLLLPSGDGSGCDVVGALRSV